MALVFVVALCGVHELEVQGLFGELRSLVHALVFPYGGIYEVLVVTLGLALLAVSYTHLPSCAKTCRRMCGNAWW